MNRGWAALGDAGDCLNPGEHQLWSHQEQLGALRLDHDCSCTPGWQGGRVWSHQALSRARLHVQHVLACRAAPGYQLLPALDHRKALIWSHVLCTKALSRSLELQASSSKNPLHFPSSHLHLLVTITLRRTGLTPS